MLTTTSPKKNSVTGTCSLDNDDYKDQCGPMTWQRSFVLWTLANLSRFMQRYYEKFATDATLATSLTLSTMSQHFMAQDPADTSLGDAAWVGIFAGLTAGLSSAVPGGGGVASGLASGILTMTQNIMGAGGFVEEDPHFKDFADLEARFSEAMTAFRRHLRNYHRHLFDTRPTTAAHRNELVDLVASGGFCSEGVGLDTRSQGGLVVEDQVFALQASLINLMWKRQELFILELPPGKFKDLGGGATKFSYDPCDGVYAPAQSDNDMIATKHYCADDGTSWFIVSFHLVTNFLSVTLISITAWLGRI